MNKLTEQVLESLPHGYFTSTEVATLFPGSDDRRYGLVKRAIAAGEIIHIRRGLYCLARKYSKNGANLYILAQHVYGPSYISLESALSWYGWIPEAVHSVVSVVHEGKSMQATDAHFGHFEFVRMTVEEGAFLQQVARHELAGQVALIAAPLRALTDLAYLRKWSWQGLGFVLEGLRIDEDKLRLVPVTEIKALHGVYRGKRQREFIDGLFGALQQ